MNMPAIQQVTQIIQQQEQTFAQVNQDPEQINFRREAEFALQHLQNNNFLLSTAQKQPEALKNAIINVASVGISLNPAKKHAYLVPRDGKVMLDISYLGLVEMAEQSGGIEWVQAKIVRHGDSYQNTGIDSKPIHNYSAFGNRGDIVGVYCTAKLPSGDYLTHEMPIDAVNKIKMRSQSFKSGKSSPWKTDEEEMIKKTCIKQAAKLWPNRSAKLERAIDYLNETQGIDFKTEQGGSAPNMATEEQVNSIKHLLAVTSVQWQSVSDYASQALGINADQPEDLNTNDATKIEHLLQKKASQQQKAAQAQQQQNGDVY